MQYGEPVNELVPQSELDEQVIFWLAHEPLLQVWVEAQSVFFLAESLGTQVEFIVPGFWQVYVLYV